MGLGDVTQWFLKLDVSRGSLVQVLKVGVSALRLKPLSPLEEALGLGFLPDPGACQAGVYEEILPASPTWFDVDLLSPRGFLSQFSGFFVAVACVCGGAEP